MDAMLHFVLLSNLVRTARPPLMALAAQENDDGQDVIPEGKHFESPQLKASSESLARSRTLLGNISAYQKEIALAESEWLETCRGIQGGSGSGNVQESKMKRAHNARLEHMKEGFRR